MNYILIKTKKEKGYALLFTLVIVMAISLITAGLSSTITKQLNLSLLTKYSQVAFSQADIASECGLYIEVKNNVTQEYINGGPTFNCGGASLIFKQLSSSNSYTLIKDSWSDYNTPCFSINVKKELGATTIKANGYSICNTDNPKSVERTIQVKY